ncbi:MAG: GIY-YIG nuclease family protein [Candidatus Vogelbacteria bacterium]|nr:GIY-YIG nuclease family protein [Candidatus Vogelbacteria bacterium]
MFIVYILRNSSGKMYIGQTENLLVRLIDHNEIGRGYTSKYRPWTLIHQEIYDTRAEAIKRECYLKTGAGRDWIKRTVRA